MTCRAARRLLPLFVGGDLDANETAAVSRHVAACADCRAEAEALAAAFALLPAATLSFDESERVLLHRRVLGEIARRGESRSPFAAVFARPRFAFAALAGALVFVASLVSPFLVRNAGEPVDVRPPAPAASATAVTPSAGVGRLVDAAPARPGRKAPAIGARRKKREPEFPAAPARLKTGPAMRLELQTGNVNVRIIWFVGGASDPEPSPSSPVDPNVS